MTTNDLPTDARVLDTRIPEHYVEGLDYGRHVSTPRWTGYYVRPEGSALPFMVARMDPEADAPDVADLEDEAAARATEAERVAAAYCGDGQRFDHPLSGESIHDYCAARAVCTQVSADHRQRFVFEDGSAIVIDDGGWDIEGDEPFSWEG